jgi:hypothetical protein
LNYKQIVSEEKHEEFEKLLASRDWLNTITVADVIKDINGTAFSGEIFFKGMRVVPDPIIPKNPPKLSPEEEEQLDFKALLYGQGPDLDSELEAAKVKTELSKTALNMAKAREIAVKSRIAARKSKRDA